MKRLKESKYDPSLDIDFEKREKDNTIHISKETSKKIKRSLQEEFNKVMDEIEGKKRYYDEE